MASSNGVYLLSVSSFIAEAKELREKEPGNLKYPWLETAAEGARNITSWLMRAQRMILQKFSTTLKMAVALPKMG